MDETKNNPPDLTSPPVFDSHDSQADIGKAFAQLLKSFNELREEYYRNNFAGHQDFNKNVSFNSRLKVPHYTTLPTTCEQGEVCEVGGKFYGASAANTWTLIGTQT